MAAEGVALTGEAVEGVALMGEAAEDFMVVVGAFTAAAASAAAEGPGAGRIRLRRPATALRGPMRPPCGQGRGMLRGRAMAIQDPAETWPPVISGMGILLPRVPELPTGSGILLEAPRRIAELRARPHNPQVLMAAGM